VVRAGAGFCFVNNLARGGAQGLARGDERGHLGSPECD